MCGIFGYSGEKDARKIIIDGLKRLEYRGYDSWGVSVLSDNRIKVAKKVGAIGTFDDIDHLPVASTAIGHTRWATHGGVTENNAHPHLATDGSFILAQNGILENFQELKESLVRKGYKFITQTDTEVIVRLIEEKKKQYPNNFREAVRKAFLDLNGRNTIIVMEKDTGTIIAVRNGSPLVVGINKHDNEIYFASDTLSFADKTNKIVYINNYEMAESVKLTDKKGKTQNSFNLYDVKTGRHKDYKLITIDNKDVEINKEGFDHYMLKEIVEQQHTIKEAVAYTEKELAPLVKAIKKAKTVYTVGAGTAGYAAGQIAYFLRKIAKTRAIELKSYEIGSYVNIFSKDDLIIAVSQSGETADTIEAVELAKARGVKVASIVNMQGSTLSRISDYSYLSRSGPEICVASTKAFTSQIAWGYLVVMSIIGKYNLAKRYVHSVAKTFSLILNDSLFKQVKKLSKKLAGLEHFFVLGRDQNYYVALEGALKVKEITYKHFEGFTAGELKHGVIALVEKRTPVFVIVSNDEAREDMLSAAAEVKTRGAYVIGITKKQNALFNEAFILPDLGDLDCMVNVLPFQLISYFVSRELGLDSDKPRNLAKSVTVK